MALAPSRCRDDGPAALALHAGVLSTTLRAGRLTRVLVAGHEVWHGVHFLLRDVHWRTPALCLGEPRHEALASGGWRVVVLGAFDVVPSVALRIEIVGDGDGDGDGDGALTISAEARASGAIEVNRLGLCLLHPLAAAGRAVEVMHTDGRMTRSTFPTLIPPWPPFSDIRTLRHEFAPAAWASAEFDGEAFEFEDQRNNADASFKTYARSNFMPRPFALRAGEVLRQQLRLRVEGVPPPAPPTPRWSQSATTTTPRDDMQLGLELTRADLAAWAASAERAAALRPDHLHLALSALSASSASSALSADEPEIDAQALAQVLTAAGARLRLDLLELPAVNPAAAIERIYARLAHAGVAPADVAVFPTTHEAVTAARRCFARARIGGGTPDFFVQLNRQDRLPTLDFLSFTICPIVHSADDETVMQSHRSLAAMLDTLRARHPGVAVQVGPSGIAARRSPLGALAESDGRRCVPLAATDPRESTQFGAAWIVAHIATAMAAGAQAVTVGSLATCRVDSPVGELWARLGRRLRSAGLRTLPAPLHAPWVAMRLSEPTGAHDLVVNLGAQPIDLDDGYRGVLPPHSMLVFRCAGVQQ